ncbi:hypothetical protein EWE75_20355 [Sphingomonas populi]|uniref:Uncharacterized protein n=1 Tax=Sphingomonas populi TaxID=2484750 RepID=A0A4Q6XTN4_9SPHN|nr:hypothetical protein [Sphingomonas populi]RZF60952.1 hypothetical protein EWE75_20355 [Sphingomonas populi]
MSRGVVRSGARDERAAHHPVDDVGISAAPERDGAGRDAKASQHQCGFCQTDLEKACVQAAMALPDPADGFAEADDTKGAKPRT